MTLDKLKESIDSALDDAHDGDDTAKATVPAAEDAGDKREASDDSDDSASDDASSDKETPSPDDVEAADKETPSPNADDAAETDLLAGFSEGKRSALLKFAPGGKITTPEQLAAAEDKLIFDYWRNHGRLAEKSDPKPAEEKPAPKEAEPAKAPETPQELRVYDEEIQALRNQGVETDEQIQGWKDEKQKLNGAINAMKRKRGSSDYDEAALMALYEERDAADSNLAAWERRWSRLTKDYNAVQVRRREVSALLEVRTHQERQVQEAKDAEQSRRQTQFNTTVSSGVTHVVSTKLVPDENKANFEKYLRFSIGEHFRENPTQPIEDINVFAAGVARTFMGPVLAAKKQALESYGKDKANDAPKAPGGKKKAASPNKSGKTGPASLSDLESMVSGHAGWNS